MNCCSSSFHDIKFKRRIYWKTVMSSALSTAHWQTPAMLLCVHDIMHNLHSSPKCFDLWNTILRKKKKKDYVAPFFSFEAFVFQHYFSDFKKHQVFTLSLFSLHTLHTFSYLTHGRKRLVSPYHLSNLHLDSWYKHFQCFPTDQN